MTALLYFLVAVGTATLTGVAFFRDRTDPARQAFVAFGGAVAVSYASFALSLLPGLEFMRAGYLFAGCWVPATLLWTTDRTFLRGDAPSTPGMRVTFVGAAIIAPIATLAHLAFFDSFLSPPAAIAGLYTAFGFAVAFQRLLEAREHTPLRVDRSRLNLLAGLMLAAIACTYIEQFGRIFGPDVGAEPLTLSSRGVVLQGVIPPFSAVFTALATYFLYHWVVMSRLLDLNELLGRLTTLMLSAGALVMIDGLTFVWVGTFTEYPFHSTFQLFLASMTFLAAYEPLKDGIEWLASRAFDRSGARLNEGLDRIGQRLPTVISTDDLSRLFLDSLHGSGRVAKVSVYLWDGHLDAFGCRGFRGPDDVPPLARVAADPFTERLSRGAPWHNRPAVQRRAQRDPSQAEVLALMDAMGADLTVAFVSDHAVLGWVCLSDERPEPFSADEILRLQKVVNVGTTVLSNIESFQAVEEQKRLAALGQMAAGLAHEIRNPLAGVKGAAQFLRAETMSDDSAEMLQVILDETDRLDGVVRQFLDYARPFELSRSSEHPNVIATAVVALIRAQGLPEGITLHEELAGDLPSMMLDGARLQQVLINLLQNGLHAMEREGVLTLRTQRALDRRGRHVVELSVHDTGEGVPDDVLDKLFVPFFTTRAGGTGLGLPICRRIVDAHGGEIDVRSEAAGTTFIVRLPIPAN